MVQKKLRIWTTFPCCIKYKNGKKSIRLPFAIYIGFESLLKKRDICEKKNYTIEVNNYVMCRFSIFVKFDESRNK